MGLLVGTVTLRPYVFLLLAAYLGLAVASWGWARALIYAVVGYGIAWIAEFSSIHNGFPFGPYAYISAPTIGRELWVAGVPFMDSLSFVFLTFAGLQTARLVTEPLARGQMGSWDIRFASPARHTRWTTWLLAGLLTMGLDVIIDPVALRGDRWFLGQIYFYPGGGSYFGVPLSNFAGWALVAWTVTGSFLLLDRHLLCRRWGAWRGHPADALAGAALALGVLGFNLAVTFFIGEIALGLVGVLWAVLLAAPALRKVRRLRANGGEPAETGVEVSPPAF